MKMIKYAIAIAGLGVAVSSAQAQLANGNFNLGSTDWTLSGSVVISGAEGTPPGSTQAAIFNPGNGLANGTLSQTFATTPGSFYTVSFDYGDYAPNALGQTMNVLINGGLIGVATSPAGAMPATYGSDSFSFTASGASTTLEFADATSASVAMNNDGILGDISVASVPDAGSTSILCGIGLIGLGWLRRKLA
jgi:hypothetical protein